MELSLNPGVVRNDTIMALFDLSANYHMDADIPHPYSFGLAAQNELREENLRKPLDDLETKRSLRRGQSPVVWIARCVSECVLRSRSDSIPNTFTRKVIAMQSMRVKITSPN